MARQTSFWPQTLRARLLLLIVPLIGCAIVTSGFFLIQRGKEAILAEKQQHLFGVTRILQRHLSQRGGFAALEDNVDPDTLRVLNTALSPATEEIAAAFPGIGIGYYHRRLDAIVTYGPAAEYRTYVGQPIPADHPGRRVMRSGQAEVDSGLFIRGNIMNAMTPIVENGEVVGYIWANELIDDIKHTLARMRDTVLISGLLTLAVALILVFLIVTRLTRDVSLIKQGLNELSADLDRQLPPLHGETGDIAAAINRMAQSLATALRQERESSQAALRQREETLRTAIEAIDEAFILYDADDRLVYCNEKYLQMLPQARELLTPGKSYAELIDNFVANGLLPQKTAADTPSVAEMILHHRKGETDLELQTRDGRWIRMIDRKAATGHTVGFRIDITHLKHANEALAEANRQLGELAKRDGLTGLFNRRHMDQETDAAWAEACEHKAGLALLMIDVDHFKNYNARYGHQGGDRCLRAIAETIAACVDAAVSTGTFRRGFAARYGGEEFAVVILGATRESVAALATAIGNAVRALNIPHADNAGYGIATVSLGGAFTEQAGGNLADLFRDADRRLYRAKENGRNRAELE